MGDGHVTFRDPGRDDHFWMLRYGVSFHAATAEDTVLVAPDGTTVADEHLGASPAPINITGYFHPPPDSRGATRNRRSCPCPSPYGTAYSTERRLLQPINQESTQFFDDHSLFDDEEVQVLSREGGKRIAVALHTNRAVILANHGLLTTGASAAEAVAWLVEMERACEVALKTRAPVPISDTASRDAYADLVKPNAGWQIYQYLVGRHLPDERPT